VDVKEKKRKGKEKKKRKENIVKMYVCVCMFYFMEVFIYDKIARNKEEFNILICSRSRIINLYVSFISNIR
jgi:ABC-type amino acid transport system permease subunit